jgi:peptidoglycan/LPS O-acetylase OafA/YrhL
MVEPDASYVRADPPAPVRAVVIMLRVLGGLLALLFVVEFVSFVGVDDPTGQDSAQVGQPLLLGAGAFLVARRVRQGYRGGLVLALLGAAFATCTGCGLRWLPSPWNLLAVVPMLAGLAMIVLLVVPKPSREWFGLRR